MAALINSTHISAYAWSHDQQTMYSRRKAPQMKSRVENRNPYLLCVNKFI